MAQHNLAGQLPVQQVESRRQSGRLSGLKRYNLSLPEELFNEVQTLAERRQTTVIDLLRRFIKLGLLAATIDETQGAELIIRENGKERQIVLI